MVDPCVKEALVTALMITTPSLPELSSRVSTHDLQVIQSEALTCLFLLVRDTDVRL